MSIDHSQVKLKMRFWDQWTISECKVIAAAYDDLAAQLEAFKEASRLFFDAVDKYVEPVNWYASMGKLRAAYDAAMRDQQSMNKENP